MPKPKPAAKETLSRTALVAVRLAIFLAFGISLFLAWTSLRGGGVPGCAPESGCDKVLSSRWGYLFGWPVSLFAAPIYAVLLVLLFQKALRWSVILPIAALILLAALWFTGLQVFAIGSFCKFCMAAHAAGVLAALLLLKNNPLNPGAMVRSGAMALGAVILLAAAQLATEPPGPIEVTSTGGATNQVTAAEPTFAVVDGEFTLNLAQVPVSGRLDLPKLVKLFDYTCHHCRDLHHLLEEFRTRHPEQLTVISLPVPLDASCNPVMKKTPADHINACEYARMGVAVFLANPGKFEEFSSWVFAPPRPPDVAATRAYAEALVGKEALAAALADPRVEQRIQQDIDIYVASSRKAGRGAMPQMLFAQGGSIGAVRTLAQLEKILAHGLGIGATNVVSTPR